MVKSVSAKMGLKAGDRAIFIFAPADAIQAIETPLLTLETELQGEFDYMHLFASSQAILHEQFPRLKPHLKQSGALWVSWLKGSPQGTDLTLTKVIEIGYQYGLVESKCLSINRIWSALKFTLPIQGKIYNNKYGTLKQ